MSRKLNDLARTAHLVPAEGTFAAIADFCEQRSQKNGARVVVATLAAALAGGISDFVSPVLPRGLRLNTPDEVAAADLDVQYVHLRQAHNLPEVIVSGHAATRDILASKFPEAQVVTGSVTADDIRGRSVIGTLPPHLAAEASAYWPVWVKDFDYSKDGDLAGEELLARLEFRGAVKVTVS